MGGRPWSRLMVRPYTIIRGSDVDRDGLYLELRSEHAGGEVAEVFYADGTGESFVAARFLTSAFHPLLPS